MKSVFPALVFALGVLFAPLAQAASDQQAAVDKALIVVQKLHASDDPLALKARDLLHKARAVVIVPTLVKGGFFIGGQGGTGVLLARDANGNWSAPAFYAMGAGSFGLQFGVEVSQLFLIIMTDKALDAVLKNEFKVGAEAGIAVATLGGSAEASTTSNAGADIYALAQSQGLFGGVAIQGGVMKPRDNWDRAYYKKPVSARSIVVRGAAGNPGAEALRVALGKV